MSKIIVIPNNKECIERIIDSDNYLLLGIEGYSINTFNLEYNEIVKYIKNDCKLEKEYENKDRVKKVFDILYDFDLLDSSILELKINGFTTKEIAKLLELTYKAVDYRMRKIRKKITKYSY